MLVAVSCSSDDATDAGDDPVVAPIGNAPLTAAGDPRAYDVQSYDVDASVTIEGDDHLDATATVVAVADAPLGRVELDLVGLDVDEVLVDGTAAEFARPDGLLSITPTTSIDAGATFTVEVGYSGDPSQEDDPAEALEDGGGWLDLGDYSVVVAEPTGARTWLPSNDVPSDKATVSVSVDVPAPLVGVSNGTLVDQRADESGTRSFRWESDEPMAPYLITVAVGDFELRPRTTSAGVDVLDAIPPGHDVAASSLELTDAVLAFFGERFGPYPFDSVGGIVVPGMPPTALETQTRPVYSVDSLTTDLGGQLVAHELAHQWFGDVVTPETWQDIWLNEGPAVYSQWLWFESMGGPSVVESARASYDPDDEALDIPPADPGDDLFGASVYERSAMFLVELRELIGVDALHELLRTWVADHRYGNATTEQFVELAGRIHGSSIEVLSDPWLYGDELPPISF